MLDMIVIGDGVIGLAVASEGLSRGLDVVVAAEAGTDAATLAGGAMLCVVSEGQRFADPENEIADAAVRRRSLGLYPQWLARLERDAGTTGPSAGGPLTMLFSDSQADSDELAWIRTLSRETGVAIEASGGGCDVVNSSRYGRSVIFPDESSIDGPALVSLLRRSVTRRGGRFTARALAVSADADTVAVATEAGTIRARHVVLAAGARIEDLRAQSPVFDEAGVPRLFAARGASAVLDLPGAAVGGAVRAANSEFACGVHLVPRASGVYLGATSRLEVPDAEHAPDATLGELNTLIGNARGMLHPRFHETSVSGVRMGRRPLVLDKRPVVGRTGHPRLSMASGTYRNGFVLAPYVAQTCLDQIEDDAADAPYTPRRPMLGVQGDPYELCAAHCTRALSQSQEPAQEPGEATRYRILRNACDEWSANPSYAPAARRAFDTLWSVMPLTENIPNIARIVEVMVVSR